MIFYFSGTGNSKYVASKLCNLLNDKVESINDIIKNNKNDEINVNGNLIIVGPSYFMHLPNVILNWYKNARFKNVEGVYFIITYYSVYGNAKRVNYMLTKEKGLTYKGTLPIKMPNNHITMYDTTNISDAKEIILSSDKVIDELSSIIKNNESLNEYKANIIDSLMTYLVSPILTKTMIKSKGFTVNDKCISCGKCANICPLNNIKIINNKPKWDNNCTHCLACISYCPKEAIDYKNKTKNKFRYNIEKIIK